ncbi:hypothetical protein, partial [Pannonibacter anstelovis]|uniref:hypothetical protein n=1 Tax=Pannonibacter anstelovis TaxID=3121537 RepID=UPI002FE5633E
LKRLLHQALIPSLKTVSRKQPRHYLKYEVLSVSLAHGFSFEQRIISMKIPAENVISPQMKMVDG